MNVGIIGYGVVGRAQADLCRYLDHEVFFNDIKFLDEEKGNKPCSIDFLVKNVDIIFLCLPTPCCPDGSLNLSAIFNVCEQLQQYKYLKPVVVKSTVTPGTCKYLSKTYGLWIVSNPEFLTEKNAKLDAMNPDKIIMGAERIPEELFELYKPWSDRWFITNWETAELAKYASNYFLAMKVTFANEMKDIADKVGASYRSVKNTLQADRRIGNTHLEVHEKRRGFDGMCFPKDTSQLKDFCERNDIDASLLDAVVKKNKKYRGELYDRNKE